MKKFHFSLRSVAVVRAHFELRAREAFASAVQVHALAEDRLATIRAHVAELESILFAGRRDRFSAPEAAAFYRAYRAECAKEIEAERQVITAQAAMATARTAYLEAHRKLKVVQRLEEKARASHRREVARAEQGELDEFASFRASRRKTAFAL